MALKDKIVEKYGSINQFFEENFNKLEELGLSRTHLYKLINHNNDNPTVKTLVGLAELTGVPQDEIFAEFAAQHEIKSGENNEPN